ncbi:acyltransferase family protein [Pseudonocardia humida]|uniref:Acyltransferase n=1 Tax=Pseudonocardia humida TaxID=2800819 RepID=A0ABT0ZZA1_9PSEU|nr:acyltransferase [Pseudonocardia humida]MCO1656062.1 acyltransferase [Pseudonocardia humida]
MTRLQPPVAARSPTGRAPHLPALDGLRGVAVLGVLLHHAGPLPGGFLGVDLFLVLSGFLITGLLLREVEATGTVSLTAFWGRRTRRLLPALAAVLSGTTMLVWALGRAELLRTALADGPWAQLGLLNWHLVADSAGYWDRFGPGRVFEHLWSIAVEEQFYLAWPVVLVAVAAVARRRGRRLDPAVATIAALAALASLAAAVALAGAPDPTRVHMGTDTRACALLLGALAATGPVRGALALAAGRWAAALSAVLAAGTAALWALADGERSAWLFGGGLGAHSLAAALLVGLCAQAPGGPVAAALGWRPLRWTGRISYSLYLWHWPLLVLTGPGRGPLATILACGLAVGLAALSTHLVEDPIRFRARWARGRSGALAAGAVTAGLAVLWWALWWALPAPAAPTVDTTGLR